jgi:hypothetical protein
MGGDFATPLLQLSSDYPIIGTSYLPQNNFNSRLNYESLLSRGCGRQGTDSAAKQECGEYEATTYWLFAPSPPFVLAG